ncbi:hypothetical protein CPB83DRAFT_845570 [Crepidotus variabilis]|uniref:F-box domain-containing protein n=1 Tax=Crepidotus variabilis TaxID=179855 RepID=A0A9P6JVN5_9AGAR|nr:hypothetical protein CPB83DRAFT_845570 [Crepidotus variabilis]
MQRRSARLKGRPPPSVSYALDDLDIELDSEDDTEQGESDAPPLEARKVAKSRVRKRKSKTSSNESEDIEQAEQPKAKKLRGNRGFLHILLDMPTDILYEVLGTLEPLDLLSVARTVKSLRAILMSKISLSVWIHSFSNIVPVPPACPDDLSYPQYAELAYGRSCYYCRRNLGASCLYRSWRARVRACARCLGNKTLFIEDKHLASVLSNDYPLEVAQLLPAVTAQTGTGWRQKPVLYFLRSFHDKWRSEVLDFSCQADEVEWIDSKNRESTAALEESVKYITWSIEWEKESRSKIRLVIEKRKELVIDRIKKLGWEDELSKVPDDVEQPQDDPLISKIYQKELTEKILHNLEPRLEIIMQCVQLRRLTRERGQSLQIRITCLDFIRFEYVSSLAPGAFIPTTADLYTNDFIKAVLNGQTNYDILTISQREEIQNAFPEAIEKWQRDAEKSLLEIFATACSQPNNAIYDYDPSTILKLAITFFQCGRCDTFCTTEQMMRHSCTRKDFNTCALDEDLGAIKQATKMLPWNTNKLIRVPILTHYRVRIVLEECGFNSATIQVEEMQRLDPIFECLEHGDEKSGRCTMGWLSLCKHLHSTIHADLGKGKRTFLVLSGEEALEVRRRIVENQERYLGKSRLTTSICTHCRQKGSVFTLLQHIRDTHGVSKPALGKDMVTLPDSYLPEPSFMLWPPRDPEDIRTLREGAP